MNECVSEYESSVLVQLTLCTDMASIISEFIKLPRFGFFCIHLFLFYSVAGLAMCLGIVGHK